MNSTPPRSASFCSVFQPRQLFHLLPAGIGALCLLALGTELERHRQLLAQWKKRTEEDKYPLPAGQPAKGKKGKRKAIQ